MSDLARVPAHSDDHDLMVAASLLSPADRAARIAVGPTTATTLSRALTRLEMDLVNAPAGPNRERMRGTATSLSRRLVALDAWEAALVVAQDLDGA